MNHQDQLGDRLKQIEQAEAGRFADRDKPLMCRLDGRAFHTFTKGLKRPYDTRLSSLMIDTTKYLIDQTHAKLGYTQSDEITLFWYNQSDESQYMFGGKYQKLTSVIASLASSYFNMRLDDAIPEKSFKETNKIQIFDARVWSVEDLHEAYLNYLWRQDDCVKNSISMASQAVFSHKLLQGKKSEEMKVMLREKGLPWEDMPTFFKFGTFIRPQQVNVSANDILQNIPEKFREQMRDKEISRNVVTNWESDQGYLKDTNLRKSVFNVQ